MSETRTHALAVHIDNCVNALIDECLDHPFSFYRLQFLHEFVEKNKDHLGLFYMSPHALDAYVREKWEEEEEMRKQRLEEGGA